MTGQIVTTIVAVDRFTTLAERAHERQRLQETFRAMTLAGEAFAEAMRPLQRSLAGFAWRWRLAEFRAYGTRRPDGRPRRTGHRHRGMRAWERRHG